MPSYRLTLQYKGTHFSGWQIQSGQKTIQGELNCALKKIAQSENIYSIGASRTDAGVHALEQVARIELPVEIDGQNLLKGLNSLLHKDIAVSQVVPCPTDFQPAFHAQKKIYQYKFTCQNPPPPHFNGLVAWNGYSLNLDLIRQGCEIFAGEHDFKNFFTTGTPVQSTVRKIYSCKLEFVAADDFWKTHWEGHYLLHFEGNGFLKQMVRLMVGALWNLGRNKISTDGLRKYLGPGDKTTNLKRAGAVAPACGLYLAKIIY